MEDTPIPVSETELAMLDAYAPSPWVAFFLIVAIVSLIVCIIRGFRESQWQGIAENLLLWFLLFAGFAQITMPKVDADDEITAAIYFVAFGVCRIAKHISYKKKEK